VTLGITKKLSAWKALESEPKVISVTKGRDRRSVTVNVLLCRELSKYIKLVEIAIV